ncbi:MAG: hypothetical protein PHW40_05030 [Candidatus Izemoplasmatales bacterium]|nr:hypothetical protein [Candidatus Izemoplasmatales bacterium]
MKKTVFVVMMTLMIFILAACNNQTTVAPTTQPVTTSQPTTLSPTTAVPTTAVPTTSAPTTLAPTTLNPDIVLINSVYDWLDLGDLSALTESSGRIIMPSTRQGAAIAWEITQPDYIAANGVITQPDYTIGDQTVTITATITYNDTQRTKEFTALVKAHPSPENTPPLMFETWNDFENGDILPQTTSIGVWAPVSNKSYYSEFFIVSSIAGTVIPGESKALEIKALYERQISAPIFHSYDVLVIEADVYQTLGGSPIYLQTSSSTPAIGFGLAGPGSSFGAIYYRTDNGEEYKQNIPFDTWIRIRLETDLVNKTIEFFYYDSDGHLIPVTPGPVGYTMAENNFNELIIRSGSSTATEMRGPSYITNIVANRIESLPQPDDPVKLGNVTGIEASRIIENGTEFTVDEPVVRGYYGGQSILVKDVDYTLEIINPVDIYENGEYVVTYRITNIHNPSDIKVYEQTVTIFSAGDPNQISLATASIAHPLTFETRVNITIHRAEGTLHFVTSATELTGSEIMLSDNKVSIPITDTAMVIENVVVNQGEKIYFVVELNGLSNVAEVAVTYQELVLITTAQEFYDTLSISVASGKYYALANSIDFSEFTWNATMNNKFQAILDGQGYTISNLTIHKTGYRGGIFSDIENATIKNLVIENLVTSSDFAASGAFVGESRGNSLIENVVFIGVSNEVTIAEEYSNKDSYAALLVSRVRGGVLTVRNLSLINGSVENKNHYGGGLIGGNEAGTAIILEDIYIKGLTVTEGTHVSSVGKIVGGLVGRVRDTVSATRVVMLDIDVYGKSNTGAIIGKTDAVGLTLEDVYVQGVVSSSITTYVNVVVGNLANEATITNVWASDFAEVGTNGLNVADGYHVELEDTQVMSWWTTHLPNILSSSLWIFDQNGPQLAHVPLVE